jgi:hypothetical protein
LSGTKPFIHARTMKNYESKVQHNALTHAFLITCLPG